MARRRKRREEASTDESWLLPYADMLTLLLALFIVLFASSSIDVVKYRQIMEAFNQNFTGGTGIAEHPTIIPPDEKPQEGEDEPDDEMEDEEEIKKEKEFEDLEKLKSDIDQYVMDNDLGGEIETNLSSEGLLLTILDNALFNSGSADVKEEAIETAMSISDLLVAAAPRRIVVAGHTDNVPIHNANYESNWDLSSYRALNFMKILLENDELNPRELSATGYGEYHPVESNDTAEGRQKNRRVEILIMPMMDLE